ncbi:MAG: hypothetical protein JKX74_04155, partial [Flavobacteriales bacterium]|nr:hypothetical protein [Flavobacteriales bacterium]
MKTTITAVALTIVAGVLTWLLLSLRTDSNDVKYIETHMHLQATYRDHGHIKKDWMAAAEQAIREMDDLGVSKCLLMPPPQGITNKSLYDYKVLIPVVKKYPNRFSLVGGGGSLNLMIQQAMETGRVTDKMKGQFREKAKEIAAAGAVGFGEMTAMHLSFSPV